MYSAVYPFTTPSTQLSASTLPCTNLKVDHNSIWSGGRKDSTIKSPPLQSGSREFPPLFPHFSYLPWCAGTVPAYRAALWRRANTTSDRRNINLAPSFTTRTVSLSQGITEMYSKSRVMPGIVFLHGGFCIRAFNCFWWGSWGQRWSHWIALCSVAIWENSRKCMWEREKERVCACRGMKGWWGGGRWKLGEVTGEPLHMNSFEWSSGHYKSFAFKLC